MMSNHRRLPMTMHPYPLRLISSRKAQRCGDFSLTWRSSYQHAHLQRSLPHLALLLRPSGLWRRCESPTSSDSASIERRAPCTQLGFGSTRSAPGSLGASSRAAGRCASKTRAQGPALVATRLSLSMPSDVASASSAARTSGRRGERTKPVRRRALPMPTQAALRPMSAELLRRLPSAAAID
jgi:hypothetical protein